MPTRPLPRNPNVEQLRNLAKTLQRLARSGESGAVEFVREFHPRFASAGASELAGIGRSDLQLALARSYGFASWARLRDHVELVNRLTRNPHEQQVGDPVTDEAGLVDEFLRLACLTYGADDPSRPERARAMLAEHAWLATATIHTAAAVGHVDATRTLLAEDPTLASREGGPYGWEPLLYVAYSRIDSTAPGHSTLEVARLLLEAGADPNAGYLWDSEYPFTALTGAFGDGESGQNTPPHQHCLELARLLLDAGADPNDSQTLYNRQWRYDDSHLAVLLEYGLGRGTSTVWNTRTGRTHPTPGELVEDELLKAAEAGRVERVRMLLDHVDHVDHVDGTGGDRQRSQMSTAREVAVLHGNTEIARLLEAAGATPRPLTPVAELRAACMRADRAAVERLLERDPGLARQLVDADPGLVVKAAEMGRIEAVRLLVEIGFDLNPTERRTPLHEAAFHGNLDLARALIALGADPTIHDPEHDSTPLGWANYNHQHHVAHYLAAIETEVNRR